MNDRLIIIGAGGHGKVAADIALKMNRWKDIFFLDDNDSIDKIFGLVRLGKIDSYVQFLNDCDFFVAIGDNTVRENLQEKLLKEGASITVLVHPNAVIAEQVTIGCGTIIMAGAIINCCTTIGKGCIINTSSSIDHDNFIQDYVHISPGVHVAGNVDVGKATWLGIGSIVCNNLSIFNNCVVGAGSVVISDIKESGTYVGIPAKKVSL